MSFSRLIKIELKIAMRKKHIMIPMRKVNMYSNRLVLTKLLKYMLTFLVGMAFSSSLSDLQLDFDSFVSFVVLRLASSNIISTST